MRNIKKFIRWYLKENARYYAKCMEYRVNPFVH